jgi:PST family polysaccharide transporter
MGVRSEHSQPTIDTVILHGDAAKNAKDFSTLQRVSMRGGFITMAAQLIAVLIQIASTVVLSRLLAPEEFGMIAMILVITNFAGLFRDLGLSSATVQKKNLTNAQQSNLFWLNVCVGTMLTVIVVSISPLVASFYDKPELTEATVALSFTFIIGALGSQHGAQLIRDMCFGRRAVANLAGATATLLVAVGLAIDGWSYWALIWATLAGTSITTAMLMYLSRFSPEFPTKGAGVEKMLRFGANVTAFDLVNYFHRNLDAILIGKVFGATALGIYSRAYQLLLLPITALRGPLNAVAFPALSRLQDQPDAYRQYFQRVTEILASSAMPLTALLFVCAKPTIELALGPAWHEVVPMFRILAAVAFVQPVVTMWTTALLSLGMGKRYLQVGIVNALFSVIGFVGGLSWGPIGVAIGYAITTYVSAYPILRMGFHGTPVTVKDFIQSVYRPFFASLFALLITSIVGSCIQQTAFFEIATIAPFFVVCYVGALWILPGGKQFIKLIFKVAADLFVR